MVTPHQRNIDGERSCKMRAKKNMRVWKEKHFRCLASLRRNYNTSADWAQVCRTNIWAVFRQWSSVCVSVWLLLMYVNKVLVTYKVAERNEVRRTITWWHLPFWMSLISRWMLDIRIPTAWERLLLRSLTTYKGVDKKRCQQQGLYQARENTTRHPPPPPKAHILKTN